MSTDEDQQMESLRGRVAELEKQLEARALSQAVFRSVLEHAPAFVCELAPDGRFRYINRVYPGFSLEEVLQKSVFDFLPPSAREVAHACFARVISTGEPDRYMVDGAGPHGEVSHYETRVAPIKTDGVVTGLILIATDLTAYVKLTRELEASQQALRIAIDATGIGIWRVHLDTLRQEWDERTCALHGVAHAPDSFEAALALVHPEDRERVSRALQSALDQARVRDELGPLEHRVVHPSTGKIVHLLVMGKTARDARGKLTALVGGVLDVSERRRLDTQLLQAQKMESVGHLTAGMAHNFNNLLTAILPALSVTPADKLDRELLEHGLEAAQRARDLIRQLMVFVGKSHDTSAESPAVIARRTQVLARGSLPRNIELELELDVVPDLPHVLGASVIEQALLNLILNARDALLENDRHDPRITLRMSRPSPDAVCFAVRDNGPGVAASIRGRLFEPFATTKEPGKGTGLGLAVSYASVTKLGGTLRLIESSPAGTSFELVMPTTGEVVKEVGARTAAIGRSRPQTRLLVVDDEMVIRKAFASMLGRAGFVVATAPDCESALRALETQPVDLLILDHMMPGRLGADLVPELRRRWPEIPIIMVSGMPPSDLPDGLAGTLHKPCTAEELVDAIETALSDPTPRKRAT